MFRVVIWKSIWTLEESVVSEGLSEKTLVVGRQIGAPEPQVALLRRELSLPFAPFPSLSITTSSWSSGMLKSVTWSDEEQSFRCSVEDEFPRWASDTLLSYEELLSMSLDEGWVRPSKGGGNAPRTEDKG